MPKRFKIIDELKSDNRMNKAVAAMLQDNSISTVSTLRIGSFHIPVNATGKTLIDGTKLTECKSCLKKRIQWKKD